MAASVRAARAPRSAPLPAGRTPPSAASGRRAELAGLVLAFAGIALLLALFSYDPHDPSLDTSSTRETRNLVGPLGAATSDLLLQSFGAVAALPGIVLLVWAWRLGSRRGMGSVAVRLASLLAAIPVVSGVLASLTARGTVGWPTLAGPGGVSGWLLADGALALGARLAGPMGEALAWLGGLAAATLLVALALGLTISEWRSAGRMARQAARATARGGRTGWRWMGFGLPVPFALPKLPSLPSLPFRTPPPPLQDDEPLPPPSPSARNTPNRMPRPALSSRFPIPAANPARRHARPRP